MDDAHLPLPPGGTGGDRVRADPSSPPVIALVDLRVRIGRREILHGLNADVRGKTIGLLGPNGAGKSTLIHALLGFLPPSAGAVRLRGQDIYTTKRSSLPTIGYMPEGDVCLGHMTGVRFLRYMGELSGLPPKVALERAHEVLFFVGLDDARYRAIREYSVGMKQKIKLAQALVHGPSIVILDEPTNALDPAARGHMLELIRHIGSQPEVNVIMSSHILRDVERTCDHVLILNRGEIVGDCDLEAESRARTGVYVVEVHGHEAGFAEGLAGVVRSAARVSRSRFHVVLEERGGLRPIFALAASTGARIVRLQARRTSLEDIFLGVMGRMGEADEGAV